MKLTRKKHLKTEFKSKWLTKTLKLKFKIRLRKFKFKLKWYRQSPNQHKQPYWNIIMKTARQIIYKQQVNIYRWHF
jgi:hypothetical protein